MLRPLARPLLGWIRYLARWGRYPGVHFDPSVQWVGDGTVNLSEGVVIGLNTVLVVSSGHSLSIGKGAWLGNECEIGAGKRLSIGERTSLQHRTQLHGDVTIGSGCVCAANLYVSSGWHEFRRVPPLPIRVQEYHRNADASVVRSRPVVIGDDCWLGINVVVSPGVTIGRGCVVGANSVVTKDLPPYTVAVGAPAKPIGKRFEFNPPKALDASRDDHVPYFYAGFRQLHENANQDGSLRRIHCGFAVEERFTMVLSVARGSALLLHVHAIVGGTLCHGQHKHELHPGEQTVKFSADFTRTEGASGAYLAFVWTPQASARRPSRDSLVIVRAEAI